MKTELDKESKPKTNDDHGNGNGNGNGDGNGNGNGNGDGNPNKEIRFTLDGEPVTSTEKELTASQILQAGGMDPAKFYLILQKGDGNISYKENPGESIKLHNNMEFLSNYLGATTVS